MRMDPIDFSSSFSRIKYMSSSENPPHKMKGYVMSTRKYGLINFLFDLILTGLTGGLWLIWIFVREMRRK